MDDLERAERLIADLVWVHDHLDGSDSESRAVLAEARRRIEAWHRLRANSDRFR